MKENSLAKRYAKALVATLQDESQYRQVMGDLQLVNDLLQRDAVFRSGMETFLFSRAVKRELLDILKKQAALHERSVTYLLMLLGEGRLSLLPLILAQLASLWLERSGVERVWVQSAQPLSAAQIERLRKNLSSAFGSPILIEAEVNADLLAGIAVKRGSTVYDMSLSGNLQRLKESMMES